MNMLAHRHLPPTPQDAAIARVSGQALSRFAATRGPLKLRVTDAEQMEPIELPAGAVALLMEVLEAMAAGRGVTIIPEFFRLLIIHVLNINTDFRANEKITNHTQNVAFEMTAGLVPGADVMMGKLLKSVKLAVMMSFEVV